MSILDQFALFLAFERQSTPLHALSKLAKISSKINCYFSTNKEESKAQLAGLMLAGHDQQREGTMTMAMVIIMAA